MAKPPQACFLDGIQMATGATMGKRTLTWVQADKIAVRIRNTRTGKTVELHPVPALLELLASFRAQPKAGADRGAGHQADERLEAIARKIATMPENEIANLAMIEGKEPSRAEAPHISRESIEWCNVWITEANGTKLPRVLLIGDSITGGYGQPVADLLRGKASVARLTTSKSIGDPALLAEVELVLDQCQFDIVHFNNGLHGWGYTEAEYEKGFPELLSTIRKHAPKAKLIWATITPMRQAGKLNIIAEGTKRVQARNEIAERIVAKEGIAVDDLYGLVKDHQEYWSNDGVHFNGKGIAVQAEQVARRILESLKCP
jgi:lysophospholipase L1-like esterase